MIDIWLALNSVHRWHTSPHLAHKMQTNAQHSGSMAALALDLWPDCSRALLAACILHDAPEYVTGDMPQGAKKHRLVKEAMDHAEGEAAQINGWTFTLDDLDAQRLKFLDRLEAYRFAKLHARHILGSDEWMTAFEWLCEEAADLRVNI